MKIIQLITKQFCLFRFKKVQNFLKIVQLITKQKKASLNGLQNFFKNFNSVYFVLKNCKGNFN